MALWRCTGDNTNVNKDFTNELERSLGLFASVGWSALLDHLSFSQLRLNFHGRDDLSMVIGNTGHETEFFVCKASSAPSSIILSGMLSGW